MEEIIKEIGEKGDLYIKDNSANALNKSRVAGLVKQYPFLGCCKEYVGFLYKYSGFTFNDSEGSLSFYGLEGELTLDIETGEGEIIDDDGFFIIGDYTFLDRDTEEYSNVGFGIDSTGKRTSGIYIIKDENTEETVFHDFWDLLKAFNDDRNKIRQ